VWPQAWWAASPKPCSRHGHFPGLMGLVAPPTTRFGGPRGGMSLLASGLVVPSRSGSIGRASVLSQVREHLAEARAGGGCLVLVSVNQVLARLGSRARSQRSLSAWVFVQPGEAAARPRVPRPTGRGRKFSAPCKPRTRPGTRSLIRCCTRYKRTSANRPVPGFRRGDAGSRERCDRLPAPHCA
jgi:hypothetical protein